MILLLLILFILILLFTCNQNDDKKKTIETLLRQAARWAIASNQDENPMIAVLHANYAAGYLWALRDIATDNEIESIGIDLLRFRDEITSVQDRATKKMIGVCPNFGPELSYLTQFELD